MIRYGTEDCEHDWVNRTDGYEEQCGPAVCLKCGAFGCWCDGLDSYHSLYHFDTEGFEAKKKDMTRRGVKGDTDTNRNWVNPYVKLGKHDLRKLLR